MPQVKDARLPNGIPTFLKRQYWFWSLEIAIVIVVALVVLGGSYRYIGLSTVSPLLGLPVIAIVGAMVLVFLGVFLYAFAKRAASLQMDRRNVEEAGRLLEELSKSLDASNSHEHRLDS